MTLIGGAEAAGSVEAMGDGGEATGQTDSPGNLLLHLS